jgi:hypothetical protein
VNADRTIQSLHWTLHCRHGHRKFVESGRSYSFFVTTNFCSERLFHGTQISSHHRDRESLTTMKMHNKMRQFVYLDFPRLLSKTYKLRYTRIRFCLWFLYGYETWSLALKEEHRLRGCESRVLRRIFGFAKNNLKDQ